MAMRVRRVLYSVVASCALAGAVFVPARAAGLNSETATIADLNAAFANGTLTSEQLVSAYLKRIDAYDKQGPTINFGRWGAAAAASSTATGTAPPPC